MKYKKDWKETKQHFVAWWNRESIGRPLLKVVARRAVLPEELEGVKNTPTPEELCLDVDLIVERYRNFCRSHVMLGEAFPYLNVSLAPIWSAHCLALYLGCEPRFDEQTTWIDPIVTDWEQPGLLAYDPNNHWWTRHTALVERAVTVAGDDFLVGIPDLHEGVDVLAIMRGYTDFCYDLIDKPDLIASRLSEMDALYFHYYDPMYDIVNGKDGSSSYVIFTIWGPGRTIKMQCDFSALMSPKQYRQFVVPSIRKQCKEVDNSLYHVDGPDAIKHVDALVEIEELDAIQWTPGAGKPDGGSEQWFPIYDKIRSADKCLWIGLHDGGFDEWVESARNLVHRYGMAGLYLHFPIMEEAEAYKLMEIAEKQWVD